MKFKKAPLGFDKLGQHCLRDVGATEARRQLFAAAACEVGLRSSVLHLELMDDDGASLTSFEIGSAVVFQTTRQAIA